MDCYVCINGRKVALTPEQVKELGIGDGATRGLAALRDALRDGTYKDKYKVRDVIQDFGYNFQIIGFNHDRSAGSENRPTVTVMAKELLPEHRMNPGKCERGWAGSELRSWLNNDVFKTLPKGLKELIQPTLRTSIDYQGFAHETTDKLFVPTESELFGSAIYSTSECGERYEAFATSADRKRIGDNGDPDWYWTSSARGGDSTNFVYVNGNGGVYSNNASNALRAPLCFQIS